MTKASSFASAPFPSTIFRAEVTLPSTTDEALTLAGDRRGGLISGHDPRRLGVALDGEELDRREVGLHRGSHNRTSRRFEKYRSLSGADLLRKPYEIHQLSEAISKLLSSGAVAGNEKRASRKARGS